MTVCTFFPPRCEAFDLESFVAGEGFTLGQRQIGDGEWKIWLDEDLTDPQKTTFEANLRSALDAITFESA